MTRSQLVLCPGGVIEHRRTGPPRGPLGLCESCIQNIGHLYSDVCFVEVPADFLSLTTRQMRFLNSLRGGTGDSLYQTLSITKVVAEMLGSV